MDYKDAIEFMLCGATAVQVGSATFVNPKTSLDVIEGIIGYCAKYNVTHIKELVGSLKAGAL